MNCDTELLCVYALRSLSPSDALPLEAHVSTCSDCREALGSLRAVVDSFASWPTDVLRPSTPLWERLARRIGTEAEGEPSISAPRRSALPRSALPQWEEVSPGLSCKILATDDAKDMVSMLVRLAPHATYPAHTHAGVEELHLLDGELWIDDRKLHAGDYRRAEPGTSDARVWSETGCTCLLVTSSRDELHRR